MSGAGISRERVTVVLLRASCTRLTAAQASSCSIDKNIAMKIFAGSGGTLIQLEPSHAKNIQPLSFIPNEGERLLLPNTMLRVQQAVSREHVNTKLAHLAVGLPQNVDLVLVTETGRPIGSGR